MSAGADPSRRLDAALWDMDGLLVDTEPLWYEVEQATMARLGGRWGPEDQVACLGGSMEHTVGHLLRRSGSDQPFDTVAGWLLDGMIERVARGVPLRPGALALLDELTAAGVPCALVSSSYRVLVDAVLGQIGGLFAVSVAGDEVARRKPDPECYLKAIATLGATPSRCVVLEDSEKGARAGVAAGCVTVCVPSLEPIRGGPGRVLRRSLTDLTVPHLASLMNGRCRD